MWKRFTIFLVITLITMATAKPLPEDAPLEPTGEMPSIETITLDSGTRPLRILTFNVWLSGAKIENGLYKIAKHIKLLQPDIVALQEVQTAEIFQELLEKLGPEWSGVIPPYPYPDNAILTTHLIDNSTTTITPKNVAIGTNIHIKNTNKIVSFWCLHFAPYSYGPYAANNKQVTKIEQILAGEAPRANDGRQDNVIELLNVQGFQAALSNSPSIPMITCGDLNSPSHLDWTEETKHLHGGWVVPWPATHLLQTQTGLTDSFRELYPDPVKTPGITWSTINIASGPEWDFTIPEPLDRIDFIFYKSPKLKPVQSFIYSGTEPLNAIPNQEKNDYPSDHFAVITDFALDLA